MNTPLHPEKLPEKNVSTNGNHFLTSGIVLLAMIFTFAGLQFSSCKRAAEVENEIVAALAAKGLTAQMISSRDFYEGKVPARFTEISGAAYKPSYNPEPAISPQCWIETGYGTQNACKYCHTDYLAEIGHGNNWPISQHQLTYDFPSPGLNSILWRNIIYPHEIDQRLAAEGIEIPDIDDVDYIRQDNWRATFAKARGNGNNDWLNNDAPSSFILFPALNPDHLFPYNQSDPTGNGAHGYVDQLGFVKDERDNYTGWRAVNFFPYPIFTPLTGSVSGIYVRLPMVFQTLNGNFDLLTYQKNLEILEMNIKNHEPLPQNYVGDADKIDVKKGFYPVSTEFAHPLHYVDLKAAGQYGEELEAVVNNSGKDYAFPGTRSKRVKEIRYMYKWKEVTLADIGEDDEAEDEEEFEEIVGMEGQGWVDNDMGWILAAYIEDRSGNLRPQTTEELMQCVGCHSSVGNTIDAVWSFQRKLPGDNGWREMDYGGYNPSTPNLTKLNDYVYGNGELGELGEFYHSVAGADLYGVMPPEIKNELMEYVKLQNLASQLSLSKTPDDIFDDGKLQIMEKRDRMIHLFERQKIMQHYAQNGGYLHFDPEKRQYFIKGNIFYPSEITMKTNIQLYRRIVLDQSFNLGKDVFGAEPEHVPFTFRSDGSVLDENNNPIPVGGIITSRPYDEDGIGITKTGITESAGFDPLYNPILSNTPFTPARPN